MNIEQFIEKAACSINALLVKWSNGKVMQRVRFTDNQRQAILEDAMAEAEILLSEMSGLGQGYEQFCATTQGNEDSQTEKVFGLFRVKRTSFLFKKIQQARLRKALQSVGKAWKDPVGRTNFNYSFVSQNPTLKEEHPMEKGSLSERQIHLRPLWAYKVLSGSRPLPRNILVNLSS